MYIISKACHVKPSGRRMTSFGCGDSFQNGSFEDLVTLEPETAPQETSESRTKVTTTEQKVDRWPKAVK